ncbi:MAG: hypothetical protein KKE84_13325 [Gammaproteobacteria bacterium]|nr:hypothetical protein [Gammaproteobacteria bacterium]
MTHTVQNEPARRGRALPDPALASASPQEILNHPGLTREEKIELLRSRQYDAAEIAVAEEVGMQGPESDPMRDILLALAQLTQGERNETVAPTKQHGHP